MAVFTERYQEIQGKRPHPLPQLDRVDLILTVATTIEISDVDPLHYITNALQLHTNASQEY